MLVLNISLRIGLYLILDLQKYLVGEEQNKGFTLSSLPLFATGQLCNQPLPVFYLLGVWIPPTKQREKKNNYHYYFVAGVDKKKKK